MVTWTLSLAVSGWFGVALLCRAGIFRERSLLMAVGTTLGLGVFGAAAVAGCLFLRPGWPLFLGLLVAFAAAGAWLMGTPSARDHWRGLGRDPLAGWLALGLFPPSLLLARKLLFWKDGGLFTAIANAYGDVAWHVANITAFAEGQSLPPENPILSGHPLVYPFFFNALSGLLHAVGTDLAAAVTWPAAFLVPLVLCLVYLLGREAAGSRAAGAVAVFLVLFGGATLGWHRFFSDLSQSGRGLGDFLLHLPLRDYSGVGTDRDGYHFLNPTTSLLLPQRNFLVGMPLALVTLLLLFDDRRRCVASRLAALALGLLPLAHPHTALGLALVLPWLLTRDRLREVPPFAAIAAAVGAAPILYYVLKGPVGSHLRLHLGWMAGGENWFLYWLKNTGLFLPVLIPGLWLPAPGRAKRLAAGALCLFALGNLFQLARWIWDNYKLLVYAWVLGAPLVAFVFLRAWERWPRPWARAGLALLLVGHGLSGGLDLLKILLPTATTYGEWDRGAVRAASLIRTRTPAGARVLSAPVHNSPVFLAGRIAFLGYADHAWSHGWDPWDRKEAVRRYFLGADTRLEPGAPQYVLVGPQERRSFPSLRVRESWELVFEEGPYRLFRLRVSETGYHLPVTVE